jgi:hypothetical protein
VLTVLAGLLSTSCINRFPYEHFVFHGDFLAEETGHPSEKWTFKVEKYPTRYALRRFDYTLFAAIDPNKNSPNAVFIATDRNGSSLRVTGESIKCVAMFSPSVDPNIQAKYPLASETLLWRPVDVGECENLTNELSNPQHLQLTIEGPAGIYNETVTFSVVTNGSMFEIDAL